MGMSESEIQGHLRDERNRYYNELIPPVYEKGKFPPGFKLAPTGWALTHEVVHRPDVEATIGGEKRMIRPIGTMDVEFLDNELVEAARQKKTDLQHNYPCGLHCPGCFSEDPIFQDSSRLMKWEEVFEKIDEARKFGLTSIKFLGPGELFQNKDLFKILDACEKRGLDISVFTKGAEIGSDELVEKIYGPQGIHTADALVERISKYKHLRILLGFNSFDPRLQDAMVGSFNATTNYAIKDNTFVNRGVAGYTDIRNAALVRLVKAGFNDPKYGQRLSLIAAPLMLKQVDEIADMYEWAALRNIPLVTAPSMESGPKSVNLSNSNHRADAAHDTMAGMFAKLYQRAIDIGTMTKDRIEAEGISAYPGTAPCNQVANGLFMRLNGQVQMCPGRSSADAVFGNVHDKPLVEIWAESQNYAHGAADNNWCGAKRQGMPIEMRKKVEDRLGLSHADRATASKPEAGVASSL